MIRILSFLLIVIFISSANISNSSQDAKIEELKRRIEEERKEIEELTRKEKKISLSLGEIKKKILEIKDKISSVEKNKRLIEIEYNKLISENEKIKEKLSFNQAELEKRILLWHKANLFKKDTPSLNIKESLLFSAYMRHIFNYDRELIESLRSDKLALEQNISKTQSKKKEIDLTEESLRQKRAIQEALQAREKELLLKTKKEKDVHIKNLKAAEASLRQLEALLKKVEEVPQYEGRGLSKKILPFPVKGEIVGHFGIEEGLVKGSKFTRKGIEIKASDGASVRSIDKGRIVHIGWIKALGNICIISHGDSYYSVYGRLKEVTRKKGDEINQGEVIGFVGSDAMFYDYPSLYFEIRKKDKPINPEPLLR